jgi:murein L,D-transpeptidase YafK
MRARLLVLLSAVGFLPATPPVAPTATAQEDAACRGMGAAVVVRTSEHALLLCDGDAQHARYAVALGAGGVGKRREGDERTPLGAYALGAPRASKSYGTFVPVGYPTQEQARLGFTGGAIGIHGPPRAFARLGALNTVSDWTAGCIAVGSDAEVEAIAAWVRGRPHPRVRID